MNPMEEYRQQLLIGIKGAPDFESLDNLMARFEGFSRGLFLAGVLSKYQFEAFRETAEYIAGVAECRISESMNSEDAA
jgi:hypothetical protein